MKKQIRTIMLTALTPIIVLAVVNQNSTAQKPLYLHEQTKTVRSNQEHLKLFASSGNVILDFYADWCNPCKRMSPLIDAVAERLPGYTFIKINRDFFPDLGTAYNITSIPTLIFLQDGVEIKRYDGGPLTEKKLEQLVRAAYN